MTPPETEAIARQHIDQLFDPAGLHIRDFGVHEIFKYFAISKFPRKFGQGHVDFLPYIPRNTMCVNSAKRACRQT